jgi:uncharacterized protein (TIGR01777 family)
MRFVLAGASGFLGTAWRDHLAREGHDVVRLVRGEAMSANESAWDPHAGHVDQDVIESADVVACLSGSPLAGNPYSEKYRRTLLESRVNTTATLAAAVARSSRRPAFLAQNGTSYYGDRGDEVLTEESGTAEGGLLTGVTREWQAAANPAVEAGARVCVMRSAPVLGRGGGSFRPIRLVFGTGLAGPLGPGTQYFPFISLEDWLRAATFLATSETSAGAYNLIAPEVCTNAQFTHELARRLRRPARLRAPAALIRRAAGPQSGELLGSFRARPQRLLDEGFTFHHPDVGAVLDAALG